MIRYTPHYLNKLEDLLRENRYVIRNEKGNFKSGFCILEDQRTIVVNNFTTREKRINILIEILKELSSKEALSETAVRELEKVSAWEQKKVSG